MEENIFVFDKYNLASFLCDEYEKQHNGSITPIKLQKGMYFLFAFWGGKILAAQGNSLEDTEDDELYGNKTPYLFNADFRAWKYGPVEYDIYKWYKYENKKPYNPVLTPYLDDDYKQETILYVEELSKRIFATSDFGLVDLSHEDECWRKSILVPDAIMNKKDILEEYASKR